MMNPCFSSHMSAKVKGFIFLGLAGLLCWSSSFSMGYGADETGLLKRPDDLEITMERYYWWQKASGYQESLAQSICTCNATVYSKARAKLKALIGKAKQSEEPSKGLFGDLANYESLLWVSKKRWNEDSRCSQQVTLETIVVFTDDSRKKFVNAIEAMEEKIKKNKDKQASDKPVRDKLVLETLALETTATFSDQEKDQFREVFFHYQSLNALNDSESDFDAQTQQTDKAQETDKKSSFLEKLPWYLLSGKDVFWDPKEKKFLNENLLRVSQEDIDHPLEGVTLAFLPDSRNSLKKLESAQSGTISELVDNLNARVSDCQVDIEVFKMQLRAQVDQGWRTVKPPSKGEWITMLSYILGKQGQIESVKLIQSSGHPPIDESATSRIQELQGKFSPLPSCFKEETLEVQHTFKILYQ